MTDRTIAVPEGELDREGIPVSYVPFRNANLLSIATSWAEVLEARFIYIGAVQEDSSGYPDCRESFFKAFNAVIEEGTKPDTSIKIVTPLIHLSKKEIVEKGVELNVPFHLTWSCYKEEEMACGQCDSCLLRLRTLTHDFFQSYPDFTFCRTLAVNIIDHVTTYESAVAILAKRARAAEQNREQIDEKLNRYSITIHGQLARIKDLSLREIIKQEDTVLKEIAEFYFKHPYAHSRTWKSRLLPRWLRTVFLSALLGHAKNRELDLEYDPFDTLCPFSQRAQQAYA